MKYAGIDPGKQGAVAVYDPEDQTLQLLSMPLDKDGEWCAIQMDAFVKNLKKMGVGLAVIEQCHAFPGPQAYASSVVMFAYGLWLGILQANGIEVVVVGAATWKQDMGIAVPIVKQGKKATAKEKARAYKMRKELAVRRAEQLYERSFKTAKGRLMDGEAEAALLIRWFMIKYYLNKGEVSSEPVSAKAG